MKAIFVGMVKDPFVLEFEDKLENYQALVCGNIEVLTIHTKGTRSIDLIFNEEGKFIFEAPNKYINFGKKYVDDIRGNILCVAADETTGEFCDLNDEEIAWYLNWLQDDIYII